MDTHLFFRHGSVLRSFDEDLSMGALLELANAKVHLHSNTTIASIAKQEDETFTLTDQQNNPFADFDYVLYAIGRGPVTDLLNVGDLGLNLTKRGHVISDEWEETNVKGIYSLGDVNGKIELTPVAIRAGRMLADRLFGGKDDSKMDYVNVPSVIFLDPPIGSVGYSENQANEAEELKGKKLTIYR